jgi:3-oxoacyl-[acyl-carrier protein] reductase
MRNVVVSGASRGLGLGTARRLAALGYGVIGIARRRSDELDAAMSASSGAIRFWPFDLANLAAIPDLARGLRREFGSIYALVNNAALGTSGLLASMPDGEIERLIALNTLSPVLLTKYVVRAMLADGGGRIVNIASIVGFTGYNGLSVYGATKASLIGFTRSLAREVGRAGITVNAVAPGFIATEMTSGLETEERERIARRSALRRLADIADVASAVEFLLDDKAKNITGTVLTVDAGNTA